mmetsp:Transcript_12638/g.27240  ORF Transcript_12638/g.27240 Transcript_12638/m.27240 type:complete len:209 (-) Transcript_12638:539-1165(-)
MEEEYDPGLESCTDEPMNVDNDPTLPGWMVVPRESRLFGNEYQSICDRDLAVGKGNPIMFCVELQEGKDCPSEFRDKAFNDRGEITRLMCQMHECQKHFGKHVTMDSGFLVSRGIVDMEHKLSVYDQALIKKQGQYWSKGVPSDFIDDHFKDKAIGASETLDLTFEGKPFLIHCRKEEKYVIKIMSTHSALDKVMNHKTFRQTAGGDI